MLFTIEFEMTSDSRGGGQVFWATADNKVFHRDRSTTFEPTHDGKPHSYGVKLPVEKPIVALRLDPSTAPGQIVLKSIHLKDKDGKSLKTWAAHKGK